MPQDTTYAAYMLRLRSLPDEGHPTWVASLQSVATGEQRSFPSVEALATFLLATFHARTDNDGPIGRGESSAVRKDE